MYSITLVTTHVTAYMIYIYKVEMLSFNMYTITRNHDVCDESRTFKYNV